MHFRFHLLVKFGPEIPWLFHGRGCSATQPPPALLPDLELESSSAAMALPGQGGRSPVGETGPFLCDQLLFFYFAGSRRGSSCDGRVLRQHRSPTLLERAGMICSVSWLSRRGFAKGLWSVKVRGFIFERELLLV